jgi:acyl-CoA thioesterase YciA
MSFAIEVWSEELVSGDKYQVTKGIFVFVAIDEQGKPRKVEKKV